MRFHCRSLPVLLVIAILFSSCYREVTERGYETKTAVDYLVTSYKADNLDSNFVFQNDDVRITYSIQNREYTFEIENVSDRPIFLDVARSSLIVNKKALNYLKTLDSKERFYYIPNRSIHIMRDFSNEIPKIISDQMFTFEGLGVLYDSENSPLSLRNQLTYGFDEQFTSSVRIENHVWLEEFAKIDSGLYSRIKNSGSQSHSAEEKVYRSQIPWEKKKMVYSKGRTAGLILGTIGGMAFVGLMAWTISILR